jgi:hypothetical protein
MEEHRRKNPIDEEWNQFLLQLNDSSNEISGFQNGYSFSNKTNNPDDSDEDDSDEDSDSESCSKSHSVNENENTFSPETLLPQYVRTECEELYISTQTKIFFLNETDLDVCNIFWNLPVIHYGSPVQGIVKKQIRMVFKQKEEYEEYAERLKTIPYYTEKVMKQIDNPNARKIKFKDVRKITVGISRKDIMNCHGKNKNAFINCFAMILRVKSTALGFREIHVKVFNTGKLAIPGIVDEELLVNTKKLLLETLQPSFKTPLRLVSVNESPLVKRIVKNKIGYIPTELEVLEEDSYVPMDPTSGFNKKKKNTHIEYVKPNGNVLINSNFNCGYYIQQEKLKAVLRDKYGLNPTYDPSMYPGVKCKFFFNNELEFDQEKQTGRLCAEDQSATMTELNDLTHEKYTKISFMIFRTGNCLIVGNCSKDILLFVFKYVKTLLMVEYE